MIRLKKKIIYMSVSKTVLFSIIVVDLYCADKKNYKAEEGIYNIIN